MSDQEPVAWRVKVVRTAPHGVKMEMMDYNEMGIGQPLYTCKGVERRLTDEVIAELWYKHGTFHHHFARAIERWVRGEQP